MNYQEMTDFEINQLVGRISGEAKSSEPILSLVIRSNGRKYDPCNSWADAGPIIQENRITITSLIDGKEWDAISIGADIEFRDKNPLRAAMIVFLMMEGGE